MTDKQVIIGGVDVSECIFHSLTIIGYAGYNYCKCFECACECHNDCYYKQLKHKEQELMHFKKENERLSQTIIKDQAEIVQKNIDETNILLIKENKDLQHQLDQLKAENEKLKDKAYILFDEAIIERDNFIEELKAECKELKEKVKELNQGWIDCDKERNLQEANSEFRQRVINRYKQTLIEIKEIAKNFCNACNEFEPNKCNEINLGYCNYNKILQKCEVLND